MDDLARYALYFTPAPSSALAAFGDALLREAIDTISRSAVDTDKAILRDFIGQPRIAAASMFPTHSP